MKKKHIIAIIITVLVAIVVAAGLFIYSKLSLINTVELNEDNIKRSELYTDPTETPAQAEEAETAEEDKEPNPYSGYEIIALVGLDSRDLSQWGNSDTMMFACIDHDNETIKLFSLYRDTYLDISGDGGPYTKANAAYCAGGPEQFLSMVNVNLDLDVSKFVTTNFKALADCIDALGGLDIDMTRQELIHMNNYNVETSEVCGRDYIAIDVPDISVFDGAITQTFHCTGTQAVSYARIRYTEGWDYKRTERQRLVVQKIKDKLKNADLATLNSVINTVFPEITTNLTSSELLSMAKYVLSYEIVDQTGFPFDKAGISIDGSDPVVPITLESNVIQLHEFLFPGVAYTPSARVQEISNYIAAKASGASTSTTDTPTNTPTPTATDTPTPVVTETPTEVPTEAPTEVPTEVPTEAPQPEPTEAPQPEPTTDPGAES